MIASPKRSTISSSSSSLTDLLQKLYGTITNLKCNHENELGQLTKRISELEDENKRLHALHEQHPHSIFDIDYIPADSSVADHLRRDLAKAQDQINALQATLNEKCSEYEDMKSKYNLQLFMNKNNVGQQNSSSDSGKSKDLEMKFKQVKEQIDQFDQCHYESEEQIRLLKQILFNNESQQSKSSSQSFSVKQSDLSQQTNYVESLLNKQQEKILNKLEELLNQNPELSQSITTKPRKGRKKRL
ncbi:unnamed protein product [Adineta ricciae]|uniref:Uncharacterized protein n=1 Tax=Adineta ricciae TaxID=249248 RepID=A0A813MHX7_ADIRI|nr:unnamed protein product [Adineta ricciae]CAF1555265.1 unnamed protein product [Adineta ricciae]